MAGTLLKNEQAMCVEDRCNRGIQLIIALTIAVPVEIQQNIHLGDLIQNKPPQCYHSGRAHLHVNFGGANPPQI